MVVLSERCKLVPVPVLFFLVSARVPSAHTTTRVALVAVSSPLSESDVVDVWGPVRHALAACVVVQTTSWQHPLLTGVCSAPSVSGHFLCASFFHNESHSVWSLLRSLDVITSQLVVIILSGAQSAAIYFFVYFSPVVHRLIDLLSFLTTIFCHDDRTLTFNIITFSE